MGGAALQRCVKDSILVALATEVLIGMLTGEKQILAVEK